MTGSSFIDQTNDGELDTLLTESLGELYDLIIESAGVDHYQESHEQSTEIPTLSGTEFRAETPLASDWGNIEEGPFENPEDYIPPTYVTIYKLLGVDIYWEGQWRTIRKGNNSDMINDEDGRGWSCPGDLRYRYFTKSISSADEPVSHILFSPAPTSAHDFRVRYIPIPPSLYNPDFTYAFQGYSGWDEHIVVNTAMKMLEKEESDISALAMRLARLEDRIRFHAQTMDAGQPDTVVESKRWGEV